MKKLTTAMALTLLADPAFADDRTTVEFTCPSSHLFDVTHEKILPKFCEQHPNIEVKMRATCDSCENGTNTILREAMAGTLPDVTLQGLNRQAVLVEKGIAGSLEPFIAEEAGFARDGYHKAMLDPGTFGGEVHGLPFSVSLPLGYCKIEVMARAGFTKETLPTIWQAVIGACVKLREAGVENPIFWGWNITGNRFLQALMWNQDKPAVMGTDFTRDELQGLTAPGTMNKLFDGCGMQNLEWKSALASFSAGETGMMYRSTSAVGAVERAMGDFTLVTHEFPGLDADGPRGLPAGGNAAMLVSTCEDPAQLGAAWKWPKFITSGEGAADVARTTGDMPPNQAAIEIIPANFYARNPARAPTAAAARSAGRSG